VLNSLRFSKFFKTALAEVIYSEKHLSRLSRDYLEDVWRLVSKVLSTKQYGQLSPKIQEVILGRYLRLDHAYYYESFRVYYKDVDIISVEGQDIVTYTQTVKVTLKPLSDSGSFKWANRFNWEEDPLSMRVFTEFKVTNQRDESKSIDLVKECNEHLAISHTSTIEKEFDSSYEWTLSKTEKRRYPLNKPEHEKIEFDTTKITHGMIVDITYNSNNVKLSFVSRSHTPFEDQQNSNNRLTTEFAGILLARQGFSVILHKH